MENLDHEQILKETLAITSGLFGKSWKGIKPQVEAGLAAFIKDLQSLAHLKLEERISDDVMKGRLIASRTELLNVVLSVKGVTLKTSHEAVTIALGYVSKDIAAKLNINLPV